MLPLDPPPQDKPPAIDDKAFERLWADLGGATATKPTAPCGSCRSRRRGPSRLRQAFCIRGGLASMIADLDADDFDRREAATKELAAVGAQAEPALRKAHGGRPLGRSPLRIERLLKPARQLDRHRPRHAAPPRASGCSQRIGTPEARAVLEDLAKGAPEVRQTQEAKAALDFLDKHPAPSPDAEKEDIADSS